MCVKIIRTEDALEFNPLMPLEDQVSGAKEIVVNYDPADPKIDLFLDQMERLCKNGISCNVDIKVESNNYLDGIKLERIVDDLKLKLDVNEVVKGVCSFYHDTDKRLDEISKTCLGKTDER